MGPFRDYGRDGVRPVEAAQSRRAPSRGSPVEAYEDGPWHALFAWLLRTCCDAAMRCVTTSLHDRTIIRDCDRKTRGISISKGQIHSFRAGVALLPDNFVAFGCLFVEGTRRAERRARETLGGEY